MSTRYREIRGHSGRNSELVPYLPQGTWGVKVGGVWLANGRTISQHPPSSFPQLQPLFLVLFHPLAPCDYANQPLLTNLHFFPASNLVSLFLYTHIYIYLFLHLLAFSLSLLSYSHLYFLFPFFLSLHPHCWHAVLACSLPPVINSNSAPTAFGNNSKKGLTDTTLNIFLQFSCESRKSFSFFLSFS